MTTPGPVRRFLPLALSLVFVLVAVAVILRSAIPSGPAVCGDRVPVNILSSSEKAALLGGLAEQYNQTERDADHCARVQVSTLDSGTAAQALARPWDPALGPRPDVWAPAASTWIGVARGYGATPSALIPESGPSIAHSPLVIAVPRPMAEALGWPNATLGWPDIMRMSQDPTTWAARGHPEWGAFAVGKTDPNASTSGLHALLTAYQSAPGVAGSELTPQKIDSPAAQDYERAVERSALHYGRTELTFLQNLYDAGQQGRGLTYISAVAVEEKSVWDYNQGNPSGDPATLGRAPRPAVPLVAFPLRGGTLVSDSPYLVLNAPWVDDAKRAAAGDFSDWLLEKDQQARFQAVGFRSAAGDPGPAITQGNGLLPAAPGELPTPSTQAVNDAISSWSSVRKNANVTVVIDRSGSMRTPVANAPPDCVPSDAAAGCSRLDLVRRAAVRALGRLGSDDKLSLVSFSSAGNGDPAPYRVDVPLDLVARTSSQIQPALQVLKPDGGTALYQTTREVVDGVRQNYDPSRINAVVLLTDGHNEDTPELDPARMLADLPPDPGGRAVRIFSIAYGGEADTSTLQRIADASQGATYDATDPRSIERVFNDVLTNF